MKFLIFLEYVAQIAVVWLVITQILIPLWKNEPWFPFFSSKRKLEKDLAQATGNVSAADLELEIQRQTAKAASRRSRLRVKEGN